MDDHAIEAIATQINERIGAKMRGSRNLSEPRQGLSFWFENYNRGSGPIFSIRPSGLKRHTVSFKFGPYAAPCIEHIRNRAAQEDYALASAFIEQLRQSYHLKINGESSKVDWEVAPDLTISITRMVSNQHCDKELSESIDLMMTPLIAAVAELIGYEADNEGLEEADLDIEGQITHSLSKKRERSRRNRLLCLSIHGEKCHVCNFVSQEVYGVELPSILEVHHIEPLSDIEQPRAYDPRTDLVPLCPNCHSAIHKRKPALTPDELREIMSI
jgi:5-methylcytosine-specific restriction protein A|tara:strand:- start:6380 stop:7195 length:816 start_codon:yes stop_codon:yes gene_type:complete